MRTRMKLSRKEIERKNILVYELVVFIILLFTQRALKAYKIN